MRFESLHLQNFMSHQDSRLALADRGLTLIAGQVVGDPSASSNGAGKTSLLPDALIYALFGKTLRGLTGDDVINDAAGKNCCVELVFTTDDGTRVVVQRARKHAKVKTNIRIGTDVHIVGVEETNAKLAQLIGVTFEAFTASLVFGKGQTKFFTEISDAERKAILSELMELEEIDAFAKATTAALAALGLEVQEGVIWLGKVEVELATLAQGVEVFRMQSEKFATWQRGEQTRLEGVLADLVAQGGPLGQERDRTQQILGVLDGIITTKEADAATASARVTEANRAVTARLAPLTEAVSAAMAEVRIATTTAPEAEASASRTATDAAKHAQWALSIVGQHESLQKLEAAKLTLETRRDALAKEAARIGEFTGSCRACLQPIPEEHRAACLAEVERERTEVTGALGRVGAGIAATAAALTAERQTALVSAQEAVHAAAHAENAATARRLAASQEQLTQARAAHAEADQAARQELVEATATAQAAQVAVSDAQQVQRTTKTKFADVMQQLDKIGGEIVTATGGIARVASMTDTAAEALVEATAKITQLEQARSEKQGAVDQATASKPYLEFWERGFSNTGLKSMRMEQVTPFLNARARYYADLLTDGMLEVEFSTISTLKSGEVRDKFDVQVRHRTGGKSYKKASDGQRRRADIIATMALGDLAATRVGKAMPNLLVLDEVFDGLDAVGIERAIQMLNVIADQRTSIFVITHTQDLAQYFPGVVVIRSEGGVSSIVDERAEAAAA